MKIKFALTAAIFIILCGHANAIMALDKAREQSKQQVGLRNLDCKKMLSVWRLMYYSATEERIDELQNVFADSNTMPLEEMGENEAKVLYDFWRQCRNRGVTGKETFFAPNDFTNPFLKYVAEAKKINQVRIQEQEKAQSAQLATPAGQDSAQTQSAQAVSTQTPPANPQVPPEQFVELRSWDCQKIAAISRLIIDDAMVHAGALRDIFANYGSIPLEEMGENEAQILYNSWKQCAGRNEGGGVTFLFPHDFLNPFLRYVSEAKKIAKIESLQAEIIGKINELEISLGTKSISIDDAERIISSISPKILQLSQITADIYAVETNFKIVQYRIRIEKIKLALNKTSKDISENYSQLSGALSIDEIDSLNAFCKFADAEINKMHGYYNDNAPVSSAEFAGIDGIRQSAMNVRDEVLKSLHAMTSDVKNRIDSICTDARRSMCASIIDDIPTEYYDDYVIFSSNGNITVLEFACAAKNSQLYKKFNKGGMFSKGPSIELHSGTIYFTRSRLDLKTMQAVDESFKGENVINLMVATEFTAAKGGRQAITNSADQIGLLFMQLGGMPQHPACK